MIIIINPLMQETIPFTTHIPPAAPAGDGGATVDVKKLVVENSIIVVGKRGCCMCHVVKRLLLGLGVNPTVFEVDEPEEGHVAEQLSSLVDDGGEVQFPAVFVGGKLFGGLERVMATHISGEMVPILKDAGALWL